MIDAHWVRHTSIWINGVMCIVEAFTLQTLIRVLGALTWIVCSCNPKTRLLRHQFYSWLSCCWVWCDSQWYGLIAHLKILSTMMPNGTWFDPVFIREVATENPCESQLTVKEIKRVIETKDKQIVLKPNSTWFTQKFHRCTTTPSQAWDQSIKLLQ